MGVIVHPLAVGIGESAWGGQPRAEGKPPGCAPYSKIGVISGIFGNASPFSFFFKWVFHRRAANRLSGRQRQGRDPPNHAFGEPPRQATLSLRVPDAKERGAGKPKDFHGKSHIFTCMVTKVLYMNNLRPY